MKKCPPDESDDSRKEYQLVTGDSPHRSPPLPAVPSGTTSTTGKLKGGQEYSSPHGSHSPACAHGTVGGDVLSGAPHGHCNYTADGAMAGHASESSSALHGVAIMPALVQNSCDSALLIEGQPLRDSSDWSLASGSPSTCARSPPSKASAGAAGLGPMILGDDGKSNCSQELSSLGPPPGDCTTILAKPWLGFQEDGAAAGGAQIFKLRIITSPDRA